MKIDSPTFLTETTFISASVSFSSGSQKFGNTMDDIHHFTGSLFITGSRIHFDDGKTNLSIGNSAGSSNTTGTQNVFLGLEKIWFEKFLRSTNLFFEESSMSRYS